MKIKLNRIEAGLYEYGQYRIYRWYPESNSGVLWCVSLSNTGMDDFRTLKQARAYIVADLIKVERGN